MRNLIDILDFDTDEISALIKTAEDIMVHPEKYCDACRHRILGTLFFEPSTRTRLSFEAAMYELGGNVLGFSPTLCTAVGMSAVFCGVTNCPITSLLISFELFGYDGMPYFLLAIAFSYMLSGYFGLYQSQKIVYSKYKTNYINKKTH